MRDFPVRLGRSKGNLVRVKFWLARRCSPFVYECFSFTLTSSSYSILFVAVWLIQLSFSLIGSLWSSHRLGVLVDTAVLLSIIYTITLYSPYIVRFLHSF